MSNIGAVNCSLNQVLENTTRKLFETLVCLVKLKLQLLPNQIIFKTKL